MEHEFDAFYASVAPGVHRLAFALTGNEHEANDLAQSAFERLYARWGRLSVSDPLAYARAVVVREHASSRRRGFPAYERASESLPEESSQDNTAAVEQTLWVVAALARLPKRQRLAVVLRHLEDMPIATVADLMGCTTGTVKRLSHDGLRALRQSMAEIAGSDDG